MPGEDLPGTSYQSHADKGSEAGDSEGGPGDSSSSSSSDSELDPASLPEGPLPEDLDPTAERRELYIFAIPLRRGKVRRWEGGCR